MKQITTTLFAAALTLAPATLFAAPDNDTTTEKKEEKKADQEVVIEANDQMQFNKKAFEIKAGETVKLTLKHVGKLPKIAMGHNVVILKKGTNLAGWASKAMTAAATDYIPADEASKKAVIAHTKVLGGGETDSITFSIKDAGEYQYLCSFPGHFAIMQGKITVK
ncbi:azurin [Akkermansiaceae bacterium]|jgi:azurin|nr:azurin [Akkermansiaceae bacterium]MDB4384245.1 azurin [Akkermansiaceae bacterium]MDB4567045.1 azurin [Akkermansiaceae bacterium]MDF1714246.1 azurin [Akkermansiaceae bacterium]